MLHTLKRIKEPSLMDFLWFCIGCYGEIEFLFLCMDFFSNYFFLGKRVMQDFIKH